MEKSIKELYEQINFIGFYCTYHRDGGYVAMARALIPEVNKFVQWFLTEKKLGIPEEEHSLMNQNLLLIVQDIVEALKQEDRVLMMDALEQGISEYLKMFLQEIEEE